MKCAQPAIIYRSPPVSMIALPSSLSAAVVRVRQGAPRKGRAPCSFVSRVFLNLGGVILRTISVPKGSPRRKVQAVKPEQFLERWKSEHIDSGTQQSDAARLVEDLLADAEKEGISRDMLVEAAGGGLVNYIVGAIKEAVEEELW
ncbi:DUF768 domain-containing protein [Sinorhizobium meliloti]|nr:DUF768 domain-containing protein [Sinorhizobium meliloti]